MKFNLTLAEKTIEVEFNNLAEQADGNVLVRSGETTLLTTSVMSKEKKEDRGFFPLTVEYEEKYYAAGKIKSSRYIKREGRPSDEAICNARLIDRAIRPRFPEALSNEVQVIATVLSWDGENDPDVLSLAGASLALSTSDIPWRGPVAAVRVCRKNGKFILNPTYQEKEGSDLDFVFSAVEGERGELLVNMIEGSAEEVEEKLVLEALDFGEKYLKELINFQKEISKKIGKEKIVLDADKPGFDLEKQIKDFFNKENGLENAFFQKDKNKREEMLRDLKEKAVLFIKEKYPEEEKTKYINHILEEELNRLVHENVLKYNKRADGRKPDQLREIFCQVGLLPRTHGSGLFCRGKTKALSILTLGAPGDQQMLEGMEIVGKKRYMHHYNFPPYSAGEVKPIRGPGRREIGHGMLAEKALLPLIPSPEDFPYTIRVVTEILSSNGSTSMASVSGSSLALMDAGVPIKRAAAGIAMGLIQDQKTKEYKILTDIQGPEDHHGDMDFKVAGTKKGITAVQMDVKIEGIDRKIIEETLEGARKARMEILDSMEKVIDKPRSHLSPYAPKILTLQIDPDKIGEVIGPGGKIINGIIEKTGATIDIQESGLIYVASEKKEEAEKAIEFIKEITKEVEVGEIFKGKVKRILDFGAFVEILPKKEGLIHISNLSSKRINKVEEAVKVGDIVQVKVISIDEQKRINLSLIKNLSKR
jgi:polyribonucleotide nucleotidyltransferase